MAWVETHSLSFAARHEADDEEGAQRTLDELEDLRLDLEERFDEAPGEVTGVVQPAAAGLSAAHRVLPGARWAAAPAGRRYLAGWAMANEIHVLSDSCMDRRAAGEDSQRALRATAQRLYVQLVVAANNDQLPPPWGPRRFARYLRWAWLVEGAAQYYSGQTALFRGAVIRRMREGGPPAFPPTARDAIILGGTIFDLLERESGSPDAADLMVSRLRKDGAQGNLELAFDRPMAEIERMWRRHLREEVARSGSTTPSRLARSEGIARETRQRARGAR